MTSLMDGRNFDLIILLLFWAVVVVALVMSTTAHELRDGDDSSSSTQGAEAPARTGIVVPLHHPQTWPPGTHRHHHLAQRRQAGKA